MSSIPRVYSSTDAGAPQLTGMVGSLIALLDAVLVDGYGVGGAAKPGAGWSKHLSAAGKRAYRNDPVEGSGFFLEVDDSATVGTARFATARGYSMLRGFGDGDDATPSRTDRPLGSVIAKSTSLGSTASRWVAVADNRAIYLFINVAPALLVDQRQPYFFGDFISYKPGDIMPWCIGFSGLTGYAGTEDFDGHIFSTPNTAVTIDSERPAGFLPRTQATPAGPGSAYLVGGHRVLKFHAWNADPAWLTPYPDQLTGGLLYTGVQVFEGPSRPRGRLPGIVLPYHVRPFADLSIESPPVEFIGASQLVAVGYSSNYYPTPITTGTFRGQLLFLLGGGWW